MNSTIIVHDTFVHSWPFVVEYIKEQWEGHGNVDIVSVAEDDNRRLGEILTTPERVDRFISLRVPVTVACLKALTKLKEAGFDRQPSEEIKAYADQAGIGVYWHTSEGFWGESVSECALALTLCGLRRIPQLHHEILADQTPWDYRYQTGPDGFVKAGQFCDDTRFTNGTVEGKRVRIVGAGNIGSRYASFMNMLGADVAAWDPFASEPSFHRAGARRIHHLEELVRDAEIFAPMVPLLESTRGIVTSDHVSALPRGCLIVMATRAKICDTDAIRKRVLADEVALAADVHDVEPLVPGDPLLGRHNVVHTPHIAGRTIDANRSWASMLVEKFKTQRTENNHG